MRVPNPFKVNDGYVDSRRTQFGWVVVYDRLNGGDWLDADERWILTAWTHDVRNLALLDCGTRREAIDTMRDAVDGFHDWIDLS